MTRAELAAWEVLAAAARKLRVAQRRAVAAKRTAAPNPNPKPRRRTEGAHAR
jgi:hypothetical protein